ncbi:hypothetical protein LFYK43_05090 [Ligilactobacillus salitolerans]|uniref:HTH lysR-type domain-containing protein n=1 Tax=Ligilactobacillus salitolerans TaxID=1808352 RepID=A0A401IR86_9LACO|nr:LysR family transcriptional regulator [Ligilactobacillus salitolerans]GBG94050.1 hypothetical protein LFYK43_05090 [Ligilactobacillus salitolerans]
MTIQQLYYLVVVADQGLISKAAYKLNISQSGLSQAINSIEQKVGFPIFMRSNAGISVTSNGQPIIDHAREVLREYDKLTEEIDQIKEKRREVFRVAVSDEIFLPFIDALLLIQEKYPDFKVELVETTPDLAVDGVKSKKYDVAFVTYSAANHSDLQGLLVHNCLAGKPRIYTTQDHYLYQHKRPVPLDLLLEQEFVLYNDDQLLAEAEKFQKKCGKVNISLITDNLNVIYEFLAKFQAVTLLRDFQLKNSLYRDKKSKFYPLEIEGYNFAENHYAWITRPDMSLAETEEEFIQQVEKFFMRV